MRDETGREKRTWLVLSLLGVYLLLAITWQEVGLLQFDDAAYLDSGRYVRPSMFLNGLTTMPLYASWFKLLSYVCADPLWRHFLSWGLLTAIMALLPVLFDVPLAWLYAGVLFGMSYFQIGPYVSLFAAAFFLAGMCVVLQRRMSLAGAAAVACAACFVVAYSRPEYQYGVFFSAFGVLIAALAERRKTQIPFGDDKQVVGKDERRVGNDKQVVGDDKRVVRNEKQDAGGTAAAVGAAVLLVVAMAYVVRHSDASRSGVAFAQHYDLKAAAKGLIPHTNEWDSSYAYDVFGLKGPVNGADATIGDFFHANPKLFLAFVRSNVLSPMTLLLVGGLAAVVWCTWRDRDNRHWRPASLFIVLISLPTLISMSLIYPDKHYLSIVFPALLLFALQLLPPGKAEAIGRSRWVPVVLLLLTIALSLRKSMVVDRLMTRPRLGQEAVSCLRELDNRPANGSLTGFDSTHSAGVYLRSARRFVHAEDFRDWGAVSGWLREKRPDWVVESPGFEARYGAAHEDLVRLVAGEMGYTPNACGGDLPVTVYTASRR